MAVLLQTTLGDFTVDLFTREAPLVCANFLKLCKLKHYNNSLVYSLEKGFLVRFGEAASAKNADADESFFTILKRRRRDLFERLVARSLDVRGPLQYDGRNFDPATGLLAEQRHPRLSHNRRGIVAMANARKNEIGSRFYFTLGAGGAEYLDGRRSIFGEVVEGDLGVFDAQLLCDTVTNRPLKNIRILHTLVLEDPFPDEPFFGSSAAKPLQPLQQCRDDLDAPQRRRADDNDDDDDARRRRDCPCCRRDRRDCRDCRERRRPRRSRSRSFERRSGTHAERGGKGREASLRPLSPVPSPAEAADEAEGGVEQRLRDDALEAEVEHLERLAKAEAHSRAVALEMLGDLPDAGLAPPDNVLFVCKLNPVTEAEDLEMIFSRWGGAGWEKLVAGEVNRPAVSRGVFTGFGHITECEVIRDFKTGESLCYAFIEFETREACEEAYFKMDNVVVDDRRIHVNFCQSVNKHWHRRTRPAARRPAG